MLSKHASRSAALECLWVRDQHSKFITHTALPLCAAAAPFCRKEVDGQATLLGFVGTPWTLAAYAMEGKADRDCKQTKVRQQ